MEEENTSGRGPLADVPGEIDKWNWGAFFLSWIWGVGNNTYRALWVLFPIFGMIMFFVLGAKGSAWAWRHKRWDSVEHFKRVQRKWRNWGLAFVAASLVGTVVAIFAMMSLVKDNEAFRMSLAAVARSAEGQQQIGSPIDAGFPTGGFQTSGTRGDAHWAYSVSGPKGKGRVFVEASMDMGKWQIDRLVLEQDGTGIRSEIDAVGR